MYSKYWATKCWHTPLFAKLSGVGKAFIIHFKLKKTGTGPQGIFLVQIGFQQIFFATEKIISLFLLSCAI